MKSKQQILKEAWNEVNAKKSDPLSDLLTEFYNKILDAKNKYESIIKERHVPMSHPGNDTKEDLTDDVLSGLKILEAIRKGDEKEIERILQDDGSIVSALNTLYYIAKLVNEVRGPIEKDVLYYLELEKANKEGRMADVMAKSPEEVSKGLLNKYLGKMKSKGLNQDLNI